MRREEQHLSTLQVKARKVNFQTFGTYLRACACNYTFVIATCTCMYIATCTCTCMYVCCHSYTSFADGWAQTPRNGAWWHWRPDTKWSETGWSRYWHINIIIYLALLGLTKFIFNINPTPAPCVPVVHIPAREGGVRGVLHLNIGEEPTGPLSGEEWCSVSSVRNHSVLNY